MFEIEEYFNSIKPRNNIIAKVMDDGIMKTKNFLVVGKDDKYLYAIRFTGQNKSQNNNYLKCNHDYNGKFFYYRWNTIFKISKEDLITRKDSIPIRTYGEIINMMAKRCKSYENIDFSSTNFSLRERSIILRNDTLYLAFEEIKNSNKCKIVKLEETPDAQKGILFNGSKYNPCFDDIDEIEKTDNNYTVVGFASNTVLQFIKNTNKHCWEFGDVVSLENSNQKVIFLTKVSGLVYYVGFDQLELFTGICKIPENKISGFYRKLDDDELKLIVTKLEKTLSDDNCTSYIDAKENILSSVKKIKDNS